MAYHQSRGDFLWWQETRGWPERCLLPLYPPRCSNDLVWSSAQPNATGRHLELNLWTKYPLTRTAGNYIFFPLICSQLHTEPLSPAADVGCAIFIYLFFTTDEAKHEHCSTCSNVQIRYSITPWPAKHAPKRVLEQLLNHILCTLNRI